MNLEKNISRRSCRDSNPRHFNHESGALTTELSPLLVTGRLRLWQNDRDLLHAICVTYGYGPLYEKNVGAVLGKHLTLRRSRAHMGLSRAPRYRFEVNPTGRKWIINKTVQNPNLPVLPRKLSWHWGQHDARLLCHVWDFGLGQAMILLLYPGWRVSLRHWHCARLQNAQETRTDSLAAKLQPRVRPGSWYTYTMPNYIMHETPDGLAVRLGQKPTQGNVPWHFSVLPNYMTQTFSMRGHDQSLWNYKKLGNKNDCYRF